MTVRDELKRIRRDNVRLIQEIITQGGLSRSTEISPSLISQYIGPKHSRDFGQELLEKIERSLGLPDGFLDSEHTREEIVVKLPLAALSPAERRIIKLEKQLAQLKRNLKKK